MGNTLVYDSSKLIYEAGQGLIYADSTGNCKCCDCRKDLTFSDDFNDGIDPGWDFVDTKLTTVSNRMTPNGAVVGQSIQARKFVATKSLDIMRCKCAIYRFDDPLIIFPQPSFVETISLGLGLGGLGYSVWRRWGFSSDGMGGGTAFDEYHLRYGAFTSLKILTVTPANGDTWELVYDHADATPNCKFYLNGVLDHTDTTYSPLSTTDICDSEAAVSWTGLSLGQKVWGAIDDFSCSVTKV